MERAHQRRRAERLACLFSLCVSFVVASGCDLFGGSSARDAGTAGLDAPEVAFEWQLGAVSRGPHAPGTWLTFQVEDLTVGPDEVFLWVLEDQTAFPMHSTRSGIAAIVPEPVSDHDAGPREDAGHPDAGARRSETFVLPVPIVRSGVFHVAVGTSERPMTRAAEVEVVLSGARMTQAAAADVFGAGLSGLVADLGTALRSEDPEWQAIASEPGMSDVLAAYGEMAADLDDLAAITREQYLALDAGSEPGMQELLDNGMLGVLEQRAAGVSMLTFGGGALESAVARSPFQALLFTLDAFSMMLAVFGIVCDVATIVGGALTAIVGGEGALIGMGSKLVVAVLRLVIDGVVPSDLIRVFEVQRSRTVYETEGSMVVPWGVFAPQNRSAGAGLRSLEDLVLTIIDELVPGPRVPGLEGAVRRAGEYVLTHLPGLGLDLLLNRLEIPRIELALPVDMGFYNITLSQVLRLNPMFTGLADGLVAIHDPELVTPYDAAFGRAGGGRVTVEYGTRSVGFRDIVWPSSAPTERTAVNLFGTPFAFASTGPETFDVQLVQIPAPITIPTSAFLYVQQAPDPADRSARISDEDFIVLDVNLVGGGTTRVVRPSTSPVRVHPLTIDDLAGGRFDQTQVDVYVNGTLQHPGSVVPDGTVLTLPLTLEPGVNEIRVVSTAGHAIGCGPSSTDAVCLEMTFPEADNVNVRYVLYGAAGSERSYRVWTPPVFPPAE